LIIFLYIKRGVLPVASPMTVSGFAVICRATNSAASSSCPSAVIMILLPFDTPRERIAITDFALTFFESLVTVIFELNFAAADAKVDAGLACKPDSFSATISFEYIYFLLYLISNSSRILTAYS